MKILSRGAFIKQSGISVTSYIMLQSFNMISNKNKMTGKNNFDVIIIGGSYSGLAAAMALGRALKKVLVIDSGQPCNRQTPHSHNFLTQDGRTPKEIATLAKQQVLLYNTIDFINDLSTKANKTENGFEVQTSSGDLFTATKLIFATGLKDEIPNLKGLSECWGISVLHCPYCHGYEVRNDPTGILGNGDYGFEFSRLISNWTKDLTLFTNGKSTLNTEQSSILQKHQINTVEKEIKALKHINGQLQHIVFNDDEKTIVKAIYTRLPFEQHCPIPEQLGCELTEDGYIKVDSFHQTTVTGVFACGDNVSRMRTVANAVAMGTATAIMINKELVDENFSNKSK